LAISNKQPGQRTPSRASLDANSSQPQSEPLLHPVESFDVRSWWPLLAAFLGAVLYSYWPTFVWMEDSWRNEPDYSHGYLVPLLAGLLCWYRIDQFPGVRRQPSWAGLSLIGIAILMRLFGRLVYADFFDAWSLLPLLAGTVWILFGIETLKWSLPGIGFLFLMVPLPYQAESLLSWKLQGIATQLSTVMLLILGQPAVSEGHVIWINDQRLLVEQACSGLRIFVGVAALGVFWALMAKRSWIDRLVVLAAILPLAVLVNALRITVVGVLNQFFTSPESQKTIHDMSGYMMIPVAFVALWGIRVLWEQLYRPVQKITVHDSLPV
jgi:exosortase